MRICLGSDKKNRVLVEEAARLVRAAGEPAHHSQGEAASRQGFRSGAGMLYILYNGRYGQWRLR